jgi:thiol-disulfide isomerase/thioredoxin
MRIHRIGLLACMLAGALASAGYAQDEEKKSLGIGDDAPPLTVSKFVKGEKVSEFEPGKVYVVEFWATWCGPCRQTIPHLTELQKKFEDKGVVMIGVDAFEPDISEVEPFLKEMGDKMDYRVALDEVPDGEDPQKGKMAQNWMMAADQSGIPTAFIVNKEGKIAWIGHPGSMDKPLEQIVEGTFDLKAAAEEKKAEQERQGKMAALMQKVQAAAAEGPGAIKKLLPELEEVLGDSEEGKLQFGLMSFSLLLQSGDEAGAAEAAEKVIQGDAGDNANVMNQVAWMLVDPDRTKKPGPKAVKVALAAAEKANKASGGEEGAVLDTLALAHFLNGDVEKALEIQEKAVKNSGDDADPGMKERLEKYRKAKGAKE